LGLGLVGWLVGFRVGLVLVK